MPPVHRYQPEKLIDRYRRHDRLLRLRNRALREERGAADARAERDAWRKEAMETVYELRRSSRKSGVSGWWSFAAGLAIGAAVVLVVR